MKTALSLVCLAAGFGASAAALRAGDLSGAAPPTTERALYVRSGPAAERVFLSFDSVAADVYWMRTIQHYGRDRRSARMASRFELLFPLLDLTTSLDPQFNIAYRFGAVFLAERPPSGPGRVDQALALLEKGLRHNPDRWQYACDIGFIYYWWGSGARDDFAAAARWFDRASGMPGAPVWLRQLAATTRAQGGDRQGARTLLLELSASAEEWVRRAAKRGLDQIVAAETIERFQRALDAYEAAHHRAPGSWTDLDPAAPPGGGPVDPAGVPYEYDRAARKIVLSATSPLSPLPQSLIAR